MRATGHPKATTADHFSARKRNAMPELDFLKPGIQNLHGIDSLYVDAFRSLTGCVQALQKKAFIINHMEKSHACTSKTGI